MRMMVRKVSLATAVVLFLACADFALEADRIPTSIDISPRGGLYVEGESERLKVEVRDQHGELMAVPSWAPRWKVSDPTIAEVARNGTMTAVGGGEVVVGVEVAGLAAATRFRMNPSEVRLSAGALYFNQAAQNRGGTVSLIPGRPALARIFVVGDQTSYYYPGVRIRLFQGDEEVSQVLLPAASDSTSRQVIESNLEDSYNAVIPGHLIQPGVGVVVEVDPEGVVPLAPGSQTRYPAEGAMALDIVEPPTLRQIFVPTFSRTPDRGVHNWTDGLNPDSRQLRMTRTLLPVGNMEVEVHEDYHTGADLAEFSGWVEWRGEMAVLYEQEGRRGYYYGVARPAVAAIGGIAFLAFPVSVGFSIDYIYTHELGHNMDLLHAPCGSVGGPDLSYPYGGGSIGIWGFDPFEDELVDPNVFNDVMGYCNRRWISDYHFNKAFTHRLEGDGGVVLDAASAAGSGARGEMLVIWGTVQNGQLTLDPAFVVHGPASLPDSDGPYRVAGIGVDGQPEFAISFTPTPGEYGAAGFVFLVPYESEWAETLDRLVLTGPEGTDTVTRTGSPAVAVVTDPATGRIRAIIRDWDGGPLPGEGDARVTITRGVPTGV